MFCNIDAFQYPSTVLSTALARLLYCVYTALCLRLLEGGASAPKHAAVHTTCVVRNADVCFCSCVWLIGRTDVVVCALFCLMLSNKRIRASVTQERVETVTAERVRTAVTISADTGHPCHVQIINLTMKTVPSECPGDGRHGMAQRGQERCRCHAATLASGWLRRADTSCCAGWEGSVCGLDRLGYKVAGAHCIILRQNGKRCLLSSGPTCNYSQL